MSVEQQQQQMQQQPPQFGLSQQVYNNNIYTSHSNHGSIGTVIAVVTVITVLGFVAGMIGRLCSGRRVRGIGQYDFESWVEAKCSSCIDGRISYPQPQRREQQQQPPPQSSSPNISSSPDHSVPVPVTLDVPEEIMKESPINYHSHQNPHAAFSS
ncbi:hypothetical protein MKX03_016521 [Papaver bracteatum]|nr:hypothetical protein MKX03_016521 [Papaver bracteatum]